MSVRGRIRSLLPSPGATAPASTWSDSRLVQECLSGDEQAWAALISKYKNLIFSIPLRYSATQEDAADIFQAVCLELFSQLSRLRKSESLRSWLITVTNHKCYHWKTKQRRQDDREQHETEEGELQEMGTVPPEFVEELEQEQIVRESIARLPERCQELVRLLFYEEPAIPYEEVARRLGLATGSIGFIRGRCLNRLKKILEEAGF